MNFACKYEYKNLRRIRDKENMAEKIYFLKNIVLKNGKIIQEINFFRIFNI